MSPLAEERTIKILLTGNSNTGKSALLTRYCDGTYVGDHVGTATIGVDFKTKRLSVRDRPCRIHLLDTAGQERFRTLSTSYYRGAHGVILVFDICNRESFQALERWYDEAERNAAPGVVTYLVGSKLDMERSRVVSTKEAESLAQRRGSRYCEVSSKDKTNVRTPFLELVESIVEKPGLLEAGWSGVARVDLTMTGDNDDAGPVKCVC